MKNYQPLKKKFEVTFEIEVIKVDKLNMFLMKGANKYKKKDYFTENL